jgi:hypothetical protein
MKFIKHMLAAASLAALAATAHATPQAPVSGTDYRTLEKAQPIDAVASSSGIRARTAPRSIRRWRPG